MVNHIHVVAPPLVKLLIGISQAVLHFENVVDSAQKSMLTENLKERESLK